MKKEKRKVRISDNILISKIKSGDDGSMNLLLLKYEAFSKTITSSYLDTMPKNSGISCEEIYQVCLSAVFSAANSYDKTKNTQFYSYWKGIALRNVFAYVQENSYKFKGKVFAGDVSLDEEVYGGEKANTYGDILGLNDDKMSSTLIMEENKEIIKSFNKTLPKDEKKIFHLLLEDFDRDEIAVALNLEKAKLYNKVTRIRKKFLKYLQNNK